MKRPGNAAVWQHPYADILADALEKRLPGTSIVRLTPEEATRALADGSVEVALIPATSALSNSERFDVLPAFALSSWSYPYAQIYLARSLADFTAELVVPPDAAQESFVASVVLQEHYGKRVLAVPSEKVPGADVNHLWVGSDPQGAPTGSLDLGREWYELTNYPMVWGLLAMRRDEAGDAMIRAASDIAALCDRRRDHLGTAVHPEVAMFAEEDLRFRFDDLATASLTELADYLFYYSGTDQPPELNLVSLKAATPDADGDHLPVV